MLGPPSLLRALGSFPRQMPRFLGDSLAASASGYSQVMPLQA